MNKYLLFDEIYFEELKTDFVLKGVCFCVFDDLSIFDSIKNYIHDKQFGNDTSFYNKEFPHFTEDSISIKTEFLRKISLFGFKIWACMRLEEKGSLNKDIYKNNKIIEMLSNFRKKYEESEVEMIFEEGEIKDYQLLGDIINGSTMNIKKKIDLYSSIPDYVLGTLKDFLINKIPPRSNNTPYSETHLDLIYEKVSHIRIYHNNEIINFSASRNNYDEFKDRIRAILH